MKTNLSRRSFVQQSILGSIGMLACGNIMHGQGESRKLEEIGLIVGVLQKELKADWEGTLRKVAAMGYTHIEFGNYYGDSAATFRQFLKEVGLTPLAGGSSMAQMKNDEILKKMIDEAHFFQKEYLVCYWPWMDSGENKNLDDFKKTAEDLNKLGELCTKNGLRLAMHNHDKEFVPVEGYEWGYEVLLKETDAANVTMMLDLYWVIKGGGDPIRLLKNYPDRFELFHVKDMDKTPQKAFTCPGYGSINFRSIFAQVNQSNTMHYIVEIDEAADPMTCVEDSIFYLKQLRY